MKKEEKTFRRLKNTLLVLLLFSNFIFSYCYYTNPERDSNFMRIGFDEYNIEVYCELTDDFRATELFLDKGTFKIGKAVLDSREDLYLISPEGEINLSEIGSEAFIINSEGNILYQMMKPDKEENEKEKSQKVFVAPSGEKYHSDIFCAGKRAFEINIETAVLFGRKPCSLCF